MNKSTFRKFIVVLCVAISILLVVCACGDENVEPATTTAPETTAQPVETTAADTTAEDTTVADTTAEDTTAEDTTAEDTTAEDTTAEDTTAEETTAAAKTLYVVNVVDEKGKKLAGVTVQFCVGDVCQLPLETNSFGTVMVELDKADYTVKVTLEGYSGEESYTFPKGSGTLNVVLTNLNPEPETTTAEPETTTAEPETTTAPEPEETFAPGVETEIVDEQVVLSAFEGATVPYNGVGAQRIGMQFNVGRTPLSQITVAKMATFACSVNEWTVKIYAWNTNYETTVAGTPLYETAGTNHVDSTDFTVAIPADVVITGEVLVVIENLNPGTLNEGTGVTEGNSVAMTGWVGGTPVAGYVCYLEGMSTSNVFAASIVVKKTVAVDPNAPVIPEFETAPYDKDYYGAKGAELFGFQWIQYLVDDVQMIQAWGYMGADDKSMVNFDGSPAEYDPYVIAEGSSTFGYYGWLGVGDTQENPGSFGYSIDGAEAVYDAVFRTSPHNQGVWDAGMNLEAVSVPDVRVIVPLTDLYGYHQIQIFYKSAAGVVVELDCILVFIEGEPESVLGSEENPEVLEELDWYYGDVTQSAGNTDGYYYTYTALSDGTLTFYFGYNEDFEGYVGDIVLYNATTQERKTLLLDGVDNYGMEVTMDVVAGDEILIQIIALEDAEGNEYPAASMTWVGNFTAPAGTADNPINIEWEWDEEYANATATVTVPAGETVYFSGNAGMILTIDGVETAMDMDGVFSITNEGEEAATYALALATPVGAYSNPEIIENLPFEDEKSLEEDSSYYYIWTATDDVIVTLTITDGANITVDRLTFDPEFEWPISEQFVLAEPEMDDNWNNVGWIVEDKLVIEVAAGQQLKIEIVGLTDWSTWTTPAVDYTLTIDVEEAPDPFYLGASNDVLMVGNGTTGGQYVFPVGTYGEWDHTATIHNDTTYFFAQGWLALSSADFAGCVMGFSVDGGEFVAESTPLAAVAPETLAIIQSEYYANAVQAVSYTVGILTNREIGDHTVQVLMKDAAGVITVIYEFTYTVVEAAQ